MEKTNKTSIFSKNFVLLYFVMMMTRAFMVSDKGISAALESVGISAALIGSLSTIFGLLAIVGRIVSGPASTVIRPNRMLAFSMLLDAGAFFCYSIPNVYVFAVGRILEGLTYAFQGPASMMILADAVPHEKYSTAIGVFTTRSYVGSTLGPVLFFSVLVKYFDYFIGYRWISLGLLVMAGLSLLLKVEDFTPQKFKFSVRNMVAPECITPLLIMLSLSITFTTIDIFTASYAVSRGMNEDQISIILAVSSVATIAIGIGGSMLADKYSMRKVLLPSIIIYALGLAFFAKADTLWLLVLASIPVNGAYTVVGNIISSLTVQQVEPERRGVAAGTFSLAYDIGFMIGPAIAGILVTKIGYSSMFMWCLLPCAICLMLLAFFWKKLVAVESK